MKAYSLGLYEKAVPGSLTWEEKFRAAAAAGYDYLEISIDETDQKLARDVYKRQLLQELILEIGKTDSSILQNEPRDITFKLVRDTRFSQDVYKRQGAAKDAGTVPGEGEAYSGPAERAAGMT